MKKYIFIFVILALINCYGSNQNKINLDFEVKNSNIVKVDTVKNSFTITFAPKYSDCITEFGANLYFNKDIFEFVSDSTKYYNNFGFEIINFNPPNRIALGFSSANPVCNFNSQKRIFTLFFKIKESNTESNTCLWLENIVIMNNDEQIPYQNGTEQIKLAIERINDFIFQWIIENKN